MPYEEDSDEVRLGKLVMQMMADPVAKKALLKEYKRLHPDVPVPELEQEEMLEKAVTPLQAKVDELQAQLSTDRMTRDQEKEADTIRRKYGIQDLEPVRTFMAENGIASLESGARFYQMAAQHEVPETFTPINETLANNELFTNPREWGRKVASQILNETGV